MPARTLDGAAVARAIRAEVAAGIADLVTRTGASPRLAALLVGDDPASRVYVRNKIAACHEVGIRSEEVLLPASTTQEEVGVADPEQTMDRIKPIIFDSTTTIPKGKTVERLLVFGPFPPKWKELQLQFSFLQVGTETHSASFNFHKQPRKG